jgi:hypothetical protein
MKTIPVIAPPKKPASRVKKTRRVAPLGNGRQSDSERIFLHDVVNQLTIISLACFELHVPSTEGWNETQRKAIAAIETAVQSAAELVEQLSQLIKDQTPAQTDASSRSLPAPAHSAAANVYPISPYLKNR